MPNKCNVWTAIKPVSDNVEEGGEKAVEGECALLFIAEATTPEGRATCMWNVCGMYVECMWNVCGMYVECMWNVCGMYVECMWNVCGMCVQHT
jgi:hypothetical protein